MTDLNEFALWIIAIPGEAKQYEPMLKFSGYSNSRVLSQVKSKDFIFARTDESGKEIARGQIVEVWGGVTAYHWLDRGSWHQCSQAEWHRRMGGLMPAERNG